MLTRRCVRYLCPSCNHIVRRKHAITTGLPPPANQNIALTPSR